METCMTDPDLMTSRERQEEVATLLARGFLRGHIRHVKSPDVASPPRELAFPLEQSVHAVRPANRRAETERGDALC